jgi:hypothetical protein
VLLRKRERRQISQCTVWPHSIVVYPPLLDDAARVRQAHEPVLTQTLVTELPIEALDMAVLGRLPWRGKVQFQSLFACIACSHASLLLIRLHRVQLSMWLNSFANRNNKLGSSGLPVE